MRLHHTHHHPRHGGPRAMFMAGGFRGGGRFGMERDHEGRGGGGRGRRVFDANGLRLVLLKLLSQQPRHGYDLIRAIEARSGGAYAPSPGVVYPTLTMLGDMELIAEQRSEGTRRSFAVTDAGEALLAEKAEEVAALFARLDALAATARPGEEAPVRRAMMNLRTALQHRLGQADANPDTAHDIAAIIDATAQKIERL